MESRSFASGSAPGRRSARLSFLSAVAAMAAMATGCALNYQSPVKPPLGGLFTSVSAPLEIDLEATSATKIADGTRLKEGKSQMSFIQVPFLYVNFTWGEGALQEATDDGNITKVHYADYHFFNVLGIYSSYQVVARGE